MEDSGNLSKKILNSIKEKLNELDAFTDDELPDYIMIMIANKKSKEGMAKSLELFLETNTQDFTDWLFALLDEMKEQQKKPAVEKEPVKKKVENEAKKEKVVKSESEENDCFDDDVIDIMYEDEITPKEVKSKSSRVKESSSKTSSSRTSRSTETKSSKNKTKSKNVDQHEAETKRTKKRSLERKPSKDKKSKEIKQPDAKRSKVEIKAPKPKPSRIEYSPKADDRKNRREDKEKHQSSSRREKSNRKIKVFEKESRKQRSRKSSTPPRAKKVKVLPEEDKTNEVKRKKSQAVSSSVKMVKTKERFVSDDEEQQTSKSMVSTVSVPVRKKPKLSKKQAATPSLLLRAIRDATTSSFNNRKQKEAKVSVEATSVSVEAIKFVQKVNFVRDRRRVQKRSDSDEEEDSKPAMPQRRITRRIQVSQENLQPKVEDKPKVETKFFVTLDKPFTRKKNQAEEPVSVFKTLGTKKKFVPIEAPDSTTTDIKPKVVVKVAPEGPSVAVENTKVTVKKEINQKEILKRKQLQEKLQLERKLARVRVIYS